MQCSASDLASAVSFLDTVPNAKTPSSEFFRLTASRGKAKLSISALLSGSVEFAADTPSTVEAYLNRKALKAFVGKGLGDGKLKLKAEKDGVSIRIGRREATFTAPAEIPSGYLDTLPRKESELELTEDLIDEVRLAAKYTTDDASTPELSSIQIMPDGVILATNRVSAFRTKATFDGEGQIPSILSSVLTGAGNLRFSKDGVRYVSDSGFLFHPASASVNAFPSDKLLPMFEEAAKWKTKISLDRGEFLDILDRLGKLDGDEKSVFIERDKGDSFLLFRAVAASARFQEKIDYDGPDTAISEEMLVPPMLPLLHASSGGKISIAWNTGTAYCLKVSSSSRMLVTPRRRR